MKKLIVTLTIIATLCSANLSHAADRYVMLKIDGTTTSVSYSVASGEVAFLLWATNVSNIGGTAAKVDITYAGATKQIPAQKIGSGASYQYLLDKIIVPGPAVITYSTTLTNPEFMAIKVSPNPNIMGIKQ